MEERETTLQPTDDLWSSYNRFRAQEDASFELFRHRVQEILLVSSFYEAFVFEQDGVLSEMLIGHYGELNLSSPPRVTHATRGEDALDLVRNRRLDLVILTLRVQGTTPQELARAMKAVRPKIPVVLLLTNPAEERLVEGMDLSALDDVFLWSGDSAVFLAMIKVIEDRLNLPEDTRNGLVRVLLVVEDSVPHYSTFLPILYQVLVRQTQMLLSEEMTEANRRLRMRTRPKVALVHDFQSAEAIWRNYRDYVACVITDMQFQRVGRLDDEAGLRFLELVRGEERTLPVLVQSMDDANASRAWALGARFVHKRSPRLKAELRDFLVTELGYGDFVFRMADGREVARASTMQDLLHVLSWVPDEALLFHARHDHFSNWLVAHGEIRAARRIQPVRASDFPDCQALRTFLIDAFDAVRRERLDGRVVDAGAWDGPNRAQVLRLREGSLGGKGRGLAFLNSLVHAVNLRNEFPGIRVTLPATAVIGTGEFEEFLERNRLVQEMGNLSEAEAEQRFLQGHLSETLKMRLWRFAEIVTEPLAIRSSSLLEDSQNCPLAGVYHTFMIPNQATEVRQRYEDLTLAVKLVLASVFRSSAREFLESASYQVLDEKMAVVVQEVAGRRHGRWFYPDISGVAQSYNYYPTAPARPEDGVAAIALGLGRTVVEGRRVFRFSPRWPAHTIRAEGGVLQGNQRDFWALDLEAPAGAIRAGEEATLTRLPLHEAEAHGTLQGLAAVWDLQNDRLSEGLDRPGPRVLTFWDALEGSLPLPALLNRLLDIGQRSMNLPVEAEFAVTRGFRRGEPAVFFPLQIRPLNIDFSPVEVPDPAQVPPEALFLYTEEALGNGVLEDVRDLVVVDPEAFRSTETLAIREEVAALNRALRDEGRGYLLIGPGRWGSRDRFLGIPVTWAEISAARVIVEVDLPDFQVESSQGSHFFHNLIARQVGYLKVRQGSGRSFLRAGMLRSLEVVRRTAHCMHLRCPGPWRVWMDGRSGRAAISGCPGGPR